MKDMRVAPSQLQSKGQAPWYSTPEAKNMMSWMRNARASNHQNDLRKLFQPAERLQAIFEGAPAQAKEVKLALDSVPGACDTAFSGFDCGHWEFLEKIVTPFMGYRAIGAMRSNRIMSLILEGYAEEMCNNLVTLTAKDDADKDFVTDLQTIAEEKYKVTETILDALANKFLWDGGGLLLPILSSADAEGLFYKMPVNYADAALWKNTKLLGWHAIDAYVCQALPGNVTVPLRPDFYMPEKWFVYGQQYDASHFLWFRQNKLPFYMLAVYNYFGVPLPQMLARYVCGFEDAYASLGDILKNHRLLIVKTQMNQLAQSGCDDPHGMYERAQLFLDQRDNDGALFIDLSTGEEVSQINTPLNELSDIASLTMEVIAAVARRPVDKLFGTPPRGFNNTGKDSLVFDAQHIENLKKRMLSEHVVRMYEIIQMAEFGRINPGITYDFSVRPPMMESEVLALRAQAAASDQVLLQENIISREESRQRIANDPRSGYFGIDPTALPEERMAWEFEPNEFGANNGQAPRG